MKLKFRVSTVGESNKLSGPGTQVHIRPSMTQVGKNPDGDLTYVIHESTPDDVHYANLALDRERRERRQRHSK